MMHVEPSFVRYALLLDPGLRAHIVLSGTVELVEPGGGGGGSKLTVESPPFFRFILHYYAMHTRKASHLLFWLIIVGLH